MDIIRDFKGFMSRQPKWLTPVLIVGAIFIIPSIALAGVIPKLKEGAGSAEKIGRTIIEKYGDRIRLWCSTYGFPRPDIIAMMIYEESGGKQNAKRAEPQINDASHGLMQILSGTARTIVRSLGISHLVPIPGVPNYAGGRGTGLYDPYLSIRFGVYHISQLYKEYGNISDAMSVYNTGYPIKRSSHGAAYVGRVLGHGKYILPYWK